MQLRFFGGLTLDNGESAVRGRGQEALLFRLAMDAGTSVGYRALAEDIWPLDGPDDPRASLQSLVSRLRRSLPAGTVEATPGGYRLAIDRRDIDVTRFHDLVADARALEHTDSPAASALAREAIAAWVGDPWTPEGFDWALRDLLEDRAHAERIARADRSDAATGSTLAPKLRATLPEAITTLVGRASELTLIEEQLATARLVTLLGPGGAGKTTLALETARIRPGSVLVELAPAAAGEVWAAVAGAVSRSIRFTDTSGSTSSVATSEGPRERALEALTGRNLLLVLDNCEHVSAEAAVVAVDLLQSVSGVRILATSREPLGVPGEAFADLGPLPPGDAAELFARRVRAARGFTPSPEDDDIVARIVRRLDGLPLALELAAAKTRTLSLTEIDRGLDDRFALLASGPRAADSRHQTLRALIDWSWETLSDLERTALLGIAVFPDGVDATDAEDFASAFGTDPAALEHLVDRSLLRRSDGRFRMLETVREYGLDRLRRDGTEGRARAHQARVMADRSIARDALLRGPRLREALPWFDANDENITAALRTCSESADLHDTGVRLVRASLWRWMIRERFDDVQRAIEDFASDDSALDCEEAVVVNAIALMASALREQMATGDPSPDPAASARFAERASVLAASAHAHPSELAAAMPALLEAVATALRTQRPGEQRLTRLTIVTSDDDDLPPWTAALLNMLSSATAQNSGDIAMLGQESEKALTRFRALEDVWGIAFASQMWAEWLMLQGRLDDALEVAEASVDGLSGLTAVADVIQQRALGITVLTRLGRFDEARERLNEIHAIAETDGSDRARFQATFAAASMEVAFGDGDAALRELESLPRTVGPGIPEQVVAWTDAMQALALLLLGRADEAREHLREAVPLALHSADQPIIAEVLLALATWLAATGQESEAHRAIAASIRIRGARDDTNPTMVRLRSMLSGEHEDAVPEHHPDTASNELDKLIALLQN